MESRLGITLERASLAATARKRQSRRIARKNGSFIYFVQAGEYIKIGISTKSGWYGRLSSLQISNPHTIKVLKIIKTCEPRKDEESFHEALKIYHVRGEWFKITSEAMLKLIGLPTD